MAEGGDVDEHTRELRWAFTAKRGNSSVGSHVIGVPTREKPIKRGKPTCEYIFRGRIILLFVSTARKFLGRGPRSTMGLIDRGVMDPPLIAQL